jgi:tRNA(fMet)-specific endonuclease VapC
MKYMLDTNICIYIIKNKPSIVRERFETLNIGDVGVSSITTSELFYGVFKSQSRIQNRKALDGFLLPLMIAEYDYDASIYYGEVRASLEKSGNIIGPLDLQIAAHALSLGVTLVTNNTKEFERVEGLKLENWA